MERRAKIVATIGPSSQDEFTLRKMIQAGMDVARLNFSHGSHKEYAPLIEDLRRLAHQMGKPVCILQDLQGPKIRIGELATEGIRLVVGETVTLATSPHPEDPTIIPVDFPDLPRYVAPDSTILLDDGNFELIVTTVQGDEIHARVVLGGILTSHKGINLPGAKLNIASFTPKDQEDLAFGLQHGVDVVAISFVRSARDIGRVRQAVGDLGAEYLSTPIIAKLERPEALDNLEEIIETADGVMVARGDLGVEMRPETVPIAQKRIIDAANHHSKLVITATQMLDSMVDHPRPTRAEASDVANAIFDGTDAVMLSGETAAGKYPLQAVEMMDAIIREAEEHLRDWGHWTGSTSTLTYDNTASITWAARELAHDLNVAAIAVFTQTGRTARLMSKAFPRVPILGFTPEPKTYHRMALYWGVFPYLVPFADKMEDMLARVEAAMIASTPIKPGQQVVVISGFPVGAMRAPNLALLHTVGQNF